MVPFVLGSVVVSHLILIFFFLKVRKRSRLWICFWYLIAVIIIVTIITVIIITFLWFIFNMSHNLYFFWFLVLIMRFDLTFILESLFDIIIPCTFIFTCIFFYIIYLLLTFSYTFKRRWLFIFKFIPSWFILANLLNSFWCNGLPILFWATR